MLASNAARLSVTGNTVGATKPGTAALGNDAAGMSLSGSDDLVVKDNLVVANEDGIRISGGKRATITGNTVGGAAKLGNRKAGIVLSGAEDASVGTLAAGNVIGGSGMEGITATDAARLQLLGNTVGLKADRSAARPNAGAGVALDGRGGLADLRQRGRGQRERRGDPCQPQDGHRRQHDRHERGRGRGPRQPGIGMLVDRSDDVRVGSTNTGQGNTIASSGSHGLVVGATRPTAGVAGPAGSSETEIIGNEIGSAPIAAGGHVARPNAGDGVRLLDATKVTVGYGSNFSLPATCIGACNRIEGNGANGVTIIGDKTAVGNAVRGNLMGDNGRYPIDLRARDRSRRRDDGPGFRPPGIPPDADKGANSKLNAPYGITRGPTTSTARSWPGWSRRRSRATCGSTFTGWTRRSTTT